MERILANPGQVVLGCFVLFLGVTVYLVGRPPWQLALLPDSLSVPWLPTAILGPFGGSLPSFLHVSGCILLSAGVIAVTNRAYAVVSGLWACIATACEILQADLLFSLYAHAFPGAGFSQPVVGWLERYASSAVFDPYDVLAVLLGAMSTYWLLTHTSPREVRNGQV